MKAEITAIFFKKDDNSYNNKNLYTYVIYTGDVKSLSRNWATSAAASHHEVLIGLCYVTCWIFGNALFQWAWGEIWGKVAEGNEWTRIRDC